MKPICPQLGKPCIEDKCVAWQHAPIETTEHGEKVVKLHGACTIYFWHAFYLKAIAARTDGTQVSIDHLRRESSDGSRALADVFGLAANRALQLTHDKG